jgi:radical SAM protein with 4Fe4S-binding SPASM domain
MSIETFRKMIDNFPTYKQKTMTITEQDGVERTVFMSSNVASKRLEEMIGKRCGDDKWTNFESKDVPFLTQVAFGADSKAESNPDLWAMMDYCREKGIIPNITVAQITDETADKLVSKCGAVAVSRYENKDICYDTVQKLTDRGLEQTNIHCMISEETFDNAWETLQDRLTDPRLSKLKAIVFLSLKKKGRGKSFTPLAQDKFKKIVDFAMKNNVGIGFDSCSAFKYLKSVEDHENFKTFEMYSEPCESSAFSIYCNSDGKFFPCSFSEDGEFGEGLDVVNCNDFMKEIWNHPRTKSFREKLLATADNNNLKCRECPLFEV